MADPTATFAQLVNPALRLAGITLRPGRIPSTDQSTEGIAVANRMLGSWNCDRLKIFATAIATYPLVSGKAQYFIGPTGPDFIAPRPIEITRANVIVASTTPPVHYHLRILEVSDWASLTIPALPGRSE